MDSNTTDIDDVQCWIEQGNSIHLKAATSDTGDPVELTAEEARSVARNLIELSTRLDYIDDDDLNNRDWIRVPMQYLHIHAEQNPDFGHAERYAGAEIGCWLKDQTTKNARMIAEGWIRQSGWEPKAVEQQVQVARDDYAADDGNLAYYDQAIHDGEVFVYNVYSKTEAEQDGAGQPPTRPEFE